MNLFHNIEKRTSIKKQENLKGEIVLKRRGAPRKPNMIAKKIKVDSILYSQVRDRCKQEGTTISSFLSVAIREELKKIEYN